MLLILLFREVSLPLCTVAFMPEVLAFNLQLTRIIEKCRDPYTFLESTPVIFLRYHLLESFAVQFGDHLRSRDHLQASTPSVRLKRNDPNNCPW